MLFCDIIYIYENNIRNITFILHHLNISGDMRHEDLNNEFVLVHSNTDITI